jgi:hypothetical protein
VLIADAAVHPALLAEPDWVYVSDYDAALSAQTRRTLLTDLLEQEMLVVCGHYPAGGIGRVAEHDGRVVWEASQTG